MPHKVGDENTWLLWEEDGFAARQVEVDYDAAEPWHGYVPRSAAAALPRTFAKLRRHERLSIALSGDSISAGFNASGHHNDPPYQGAYPALLAAALEKTYGGKVDLLNVSVAGLRADAAMASLPRVLDAEPDLVIVAYGMNDVGRRDPAAYAKTVQTFIDAVRAKRPEAEFIVAATSRGNPEWNAIPADQFPKYRDALAALCGDERHVALADLTALWSDLLGRKRYADLTGNGLNHPNDFGHRLYAQVLAQMLAPLPEDR
jgi:lysophospholipase L1-like esterase